VRTLRTGVHGPAGRASAAPVTHFQAIFLPSVICLPRNCCSAVNVPKSQRDTCTAVRSAGPGAAGIPPGGAGSWFQKS